MENKKFLNGTELGSKREPATNASSAPVDVATEVIELCDDALDAVSAGCIFEIYSDQEGWRWEVIEDSTGEVLATGSDEAWALAEADSSGQSSDKLDWDELERLRYAYRHGYPPGSLYSGHGGLP